VDAAYRSPFDGDTDLICEELQPGWSCWVYQGIAVTMPAMQQGWTEIQRRSYIARRDANLMGMCPLCEAKIPFAYTARAVQRVAMAHDLACPISDDNFFRTFAVQA